MSGNHGGSNNNEWLMVLVLVSILCVVGWYWFGSELMTITIYISKQHLKCLEILLGLTDYAWILHPGLSVESLKEAKRYLYTIDPAFATFDEFQMLMTFNTTTLRTLVIPVLIYFMISMYRNQSARRRKTKYSIHSLAKESAKYNPQLRPVLLQNILNIDPDVGPTAREVSPIRFAIQKGLIKVFAQDYMNRNTTELLKPTFDQSLKGIGNIIVLQDDLKNSISTIHNRCFLDKDALKRTFKEQLGPIYDSYDDLSIARQALMSIFVAFAQGEESGGKREAFKLIDQLNSDFDPENAEGKWFKMAYAYELYEKYKDSAALQDVLAQHCYQLTVLPGMLERARTKGKLFTSLFYWVKLVDRPLWYAVHQEGGETGWTEAAAARSHKLAESTAGGRLYTPFIESAEFAFEEFLYNTEGWMPLRDEDKEVRTLV